MPITTTVTWQDLRDAQQRELDDLADAYDDLEATIESEYGGDLTTTPTDLSNIEDPDLRQQAAIAQQMQLLDRSAETIEQRLNLLDTLETELGSGPWEIRMLTGQQVMDVEAQLRADADTQDWDRQTIQLHRNQRTVDAAVVDGPEDIPRNEDGTLQVCDHCPNALVNSLYEAVERFNSAGDTDFRAQGFGSDTGLARPGSSGTPTPSQPVSGGSVPSDDSAPERGTDS